MVRRSIVAFLALMVAPGGIAGAQDVDLAPSLDLRGVAGRFDLLAGSVIVAEGKTRIAISQVSERGAIALYDISGAFIALLGRRGKGPGEFLQHDGLAFGDGDSLFVLDGLNLRATVFAPDGRLARTFPLEAHALNPARVGHQFFVSVPNASTKGRQGLVFPLLVKGGFGPSVQPGDNDGEEDFDRIRLLAGAGDSGVVISKVYAYHVTLASSSGHQLAEVRPRVDWFPAGRVAMREPPWLVRPMPMILGARVLGSDLFVLIQRAKARWKPLTMGGSLVSPKGPNLARENFFEIVLERRSIPEGKLKAQQILSPFVVAMAGADKLVSVVDAPDGTNIVRLSRIRLATRNNPPRRD